MSSLDKAARSKVGMCNYIVNLTDPQEADTEFVGWIKSAYEQAG